MQANHNGNRLFISHLTDIEGNLSYFERWVKRSKELQYVDGRLSFHNSDGQFVFGGDSCDKGPGDLRLGKVLVDFKQANPDRVTLIAGNRDIKSRRFTYELTSMIHQRLLDGDAAFWNPAMPPRQYAIYQMQAEHKSTKSETDIRNYVLGLSTEACQTLYLKWMLKETMGCGSFHNKPTTFEYRRMELAAISGQAADEISDDMVTRSFIDSVMPAGYLHSYLQQAQLGYILGETLFIHGAITIENMGYLPGMSDSDARITDAREWIEQLNAWYTSEVREWLEVPVEETLHTPGHKPLDEYVVFNPKSIVTSNWYQRDQFAPIRKEVVKFLNDAGIFRVVSGHQPCSDFPLIIRDPDLEVIVGDTGYSDPSAKNDNRGEALHNLTIVEQGNRGFASIDAIRRDGSNMVLNLPSRTEISEGNDTVIGHFTIDCRLIRPANASQLLASQLDGFSVVDRPFKP